MLILSQCKKIYLAIVKRMILIASIFTKIVSYAFELLVLDKKKSFHVWNKKYYEELFVSSTKDFVYLNADTLRTYDV